MLVHSFFGKWFGSFSCRRSLNNHFVQHSFVITLMKKKKMKTIPGQGPLPVWISQVLPMSAQVFSGTLVSSHIPQIGMLGSLLCLSCPCLNVALCQCTLWWNGVLQTWFPPCATTSSRGDSSCLRSWTEISLLENQDYKWLFNVKCFGSAFRSLVLFLWPGMCGRNFTLVCIKFPVLKLISLYVILHKVSVSKNLLMLLSENLLYS